MLGDLIKSLIGPILGPLIDRIPDPNERARAKEAAEASMIAAMTTLVQGQLEINKAEAEHHSVFVAGWRPFIGWVCGVGFAYAFVLHPFIMWAAFLLPEAPVNLSTAPQIEVGELMTLALGMLGLGGLRTYEKRVGVETKRVVQKGD